MIHHIERHIENMKQKPEHVRKRYAFVVSGIFTLIIFFGWIASYGIINTPSKDALATKAPIQSLTAGVGDVWDYIKDMFNGSNQAEYVSPDIEVLPGKR